MALFIPVINAQNSNPSKKKANKHALSLQVPFNGNKAGLGLRFSYDFTKVLRFTIDGDYYFYSSDNRKFYTISSSGALGYGYYGRQWDVNINLNFVFGEKDFHFYLITGLYYATGFHDLNRIVDDNGVIINHQIYYYEDRVEYGPGFGVNLGCGIEYQCSDKIRIFVDQQLGVGILTSWMAKLGCAYCF